MLIERLLLRRLNKLSQVNKLSLMSYLENKFKILCGLKKILLYASKFKNTYSKIYYNFTGT